MPPKARRKPCPDRSSERLQIYLTTKCFICLDTPNIHTSQPLPCCGQNIHEDCLLGCLCFANQAVQDTCPHCRATLTPYHISDVNIPLGPNLFCFQWLMYPHHHHHHRTPTSGSRIMVSLSRMMILFLAMSFPNHRLVGTILGDISIKL